MKESIVKFPVDTADAGDDDVMGAGYPMPNLPDFAAQFSPPRTSYTTRYNLPSGVTIVVERITDGFNTTAEINVQGEIPTDRVMADVMSVIQRIPA